MPAGMYDRGRVRSIVKPGVFLANLTLVRLLLSEHGELFMRIQRQLKLCYVILFCL
jgi:hypothetical protein